MNRALLLAIALVPILSTGRIGKGQTGVPCYYDWSSAPRQHFMIADSPEYKAILRACAQGRANTVPWDEYARTFQTGADMRALAGDAQANLLRLIDMVRKERDHLRSAAAARSSPPGPAASGTGTRATDIGPMIREPIRSDRFAIAPEFRSWVPQLLRDMVAARLYTTVRLVGFTGDVVIRRGDRVARLLDIVRKGELLQLNTGDIFEAREGSIELELDGAVFTVRRNSSVMIGFTECLTTVQQTGGSPAPRVASMHLIDGVLLYATTTHQVRAKCVMAAHGIAVAVRGTAFRAMHLPDAQGGVLEVDVSSGSVVVEDRATSRTWNLNAGDRRVIEYGAPASPSAQLPAPLEYAWDVQNNCTRDVDFKLFEVDARDQVIGSWKAVSIGAGQRTRIPIRPKPGGKVCWGAGAREGNLRWGLGLDGEGTCERCCSVTSEASGAATRSANLTCPGK